MVPNIAREHIRAFRPARRCGLQSLTAAAQRGVRLLTGIPGEHGFGGQAILRSGISEHEALSHRRDLREIPVSTAARGNQGTLCHDREAVQQECGLWPLRCIWTEGYH